MKKAIIRQEDITCNNIYAPYQGGLKYIKQLLPELKGETKLANTLIWYFHPQKL